MLFNTVSFIIFFLIVLTLYYFLPRKYTWIMLLIASLYFYMCWRWQYIFLLFFPATIDFFVARTIEDTPEKKKKKGLLLISIFTNLGLLFYFKYYNFFVDSFNTVATAMDSNFLINSAKIILPVGISFYTFQSISYTVEVYRGHIKAERHFGRFALFVSYFPQLVAGPINRPQILLPQLKNLEPLQAKNFIAGGRQMLWGLFKKIVVADRLAVFVNIVYNDPGQYHGASLLIATIFFAFQIYCDFSGYSDIAIGVAKTMGVDLVKNFDKPYFAHSIKEFWAKWHISLSTWFRDYLYIPMGGNRASVGRWVFNLFITFLVSGIWHGASFNFVIWGAIHGVLIALEALNSKYKFLPVKLPGILSNLLTFTLVSFAWIFFRANTVHDSFTIIRQMFDWSHSFRAEIAGLNGSNMYNLALGFPLILCLLIFEKLAEWPRAIGWFHQSIAIRYFCYITLILFIAMFGVLVSQSSFIYFQF